MNGLSGREYLRSSFFIVEIVLFIAYWFYVAFDFSNGVIVSRIRPDVFDAPVVIESLQDYSSLTFLFNNVDTLIFLFFAILGISYLLWKQKPAYASVFGLFALLTIILYVPTPIQTVWQTMTLFCFDRFMLFISPFMAFVMGWGLYIASGYLQKRIPVKTAGLIVLLFFVVYCCGATGIIVAEDTSASRVSFTFEELDGFSHIISYVPYGSTIYSDYYTSRYFSQTRFSESDALGLPFYRSRAIQDVADISLYQGFVIIPRNLFMEHGLAFIREGELERGGGGTHPYLPSNETISALSNSLVGKEKIYSSGFTELYYS